MLLLVSLTLLSGCWDQKTLQDLNYLTAIGLDYVDKEYVVYGQTVDLSSVAKQESAEPMKSPPAVISIGRGETLQSAMDNLQKNAQIPLFTGFVSAIVFHERLLQRDILPAYDIMNRFGLLRYTKWVFGTRESIAAIMGNHSIIGFSPLVSLLHQPQDVYEQHSLIEPLRFYRFISRFWEPSSTVLIPNITINTHSWKENNRFISRLSLDGVHAIHRGKWKGYFPSQDLMGLRWMTPQTKMAGLIIRERGIPKATVRIYEVKVDIRTIQTGDHPRFHIDVRVDGFIRELMSKIPVASIMSNVEKQVATQIRNTFLKGIAQGADLYRLEETLYKQDVQAWKQFAKNRANRIAADAIAELSVHVRITNSGKMKRDWYNYPNDLLPAP